MMFSRNNNKKNEPIPASMQEWPNHDESWAEFILRVDSEQKESPSVAIILAVLILTPCLCWLIISNMDKSFM